MRWHNILRHWLHEKTRSQYQPTFVEEDIPDRPKTKALYIVTENNVPWSAAMVCPCGCGTVIHLNLLPDDHPVWNLAHQQNNTVSLSPSVWLKAGCCSHFWFRENQIFWVQDQPNALALIRNLKFLLRRN